MKMLTWIELSEIHTYLGLKILPFFSEGGQKVGQPWPPQSPLWHRPCTLCASLSQPKCIQLPTPTHNAHKPTRTHPQRTPPHTHTNADHTKSILFSHQHTTHTLTKHTSTNTYIHKHTHTHTHHFTIVIPISLWRLIIIGSLMILTLWDTLKLLNYNIHIWREWSTENIQAPCSWELNTKLIPKVQKTATCLEKPQPNYTDSHRSGQSS